MGATGYNEKQCILTALRLWLLESRHSNRTLNESIAIFDAEATKYDFTCLSAVLLVFLFLSSQDSPLAQQKLREEFLVLNGDEAAAMEAEEEETSGVASLLKRK